MYFVFSKVLLFLILPINWIIGSIIIALIIKNTRLKRRFLWLSVGLFLVFTNPLILNLFSRFWDVPAGPLTQHTYSAAIVLGGFAGEKNANQEGYFNGAADRYIQAVKLKMTGKVSHLFISGGNGTLMKIKDDSFIESTWVKSEMVKLGIPDSVIFTETGSRNTFENATFSKPLLAKANLKPPYILITSAVHMRRSLYIFKKVGIPVIPYPCNYMMGIDRFSFREFIPDADVLSEWNYYIKEIIGYIVTAIKGKI